MVIVSLDVIEHFFNQIESGRIETEFGIYNVKMYVNDVKNNDYNNLVPILRVRSKEKFRLKVEEYIVKLLIFENKDIKCVNNDFIIDALAHLFANATFDDIINPENFIDKYIAFMEMPSINTQNVDNIFDDFLKSNDMTYNSSLISKIEKQSLFQETPFIFKSSIVNEYSDKQLEYPLPNISFGISDNRCYIYAIQKGKKKAEDDNSSKFAKKVQRLLYKLDDKVKENESQEYLDYLNNQTDYYPENISDVVPSVILALSLFLKTLYDNGIKNISVVSFLPIRYNAKKISFDYKIKYEASKRLLDEQQVEELAQSYECEQLRIQNNLTQKLLRNFSRLKFHFNNIEFEGYPFVNDEYLRINIGNFEKTNNIILDKIIKNNKIR